MVRESWAGEAGLERRGQAVDILADTGPLPQRRTVVDQDAHARRIVAHGKRGKSLAFNRLTRFFWLCYR